MRIGWIHRVCKMRPVWIRPVYTVRLERMLVDPDEDMQTLMKEAGAAEKEGAQVEKHKQKK